MKKPSSSPSIRPYQHGEREFIHLSLHLHSLISTMLHKPFSESAAPNSVQRRSVNGWHPQQPRLNGPGITNTATLTTCHSTLARRSRMALAHTCSVLRGVPGVRAAAQASVSAQTHTTLKHSIEMPHTLEFRGYRRQQESPCHHTNMAIRTLHPTRMSSNSTGPAAASKAQGEI